MVDKYSKIEEVDDKTAIRRRIDRHIHNNIEKKDKEKGENE